MKVIKKGTIEVTCTGEGNSSKGCGSILEIEYGDPYFTYESSYRSGRGAQCVTIECCVCKAKTDIGSEYKHLVEDKSE